ncbi:MAG: peptide chain release factor N(5)-glutamine methyltransferase [Lachnospiraceae bacterium]|nr:peptide chain release factor N(5)-glutamine methyltransferase [Lachnospiraceae bacterium]
MLKRGEKFLSEACREEAATDSWLLFSWLLEMNRAEYIVKERERPSEKELRTYQSLLERRASHIPLQYIIGEQEFMGLSFLVNEHVLIPRMDTEILVETALPYVSEKSVLDLCTGSGCIAVSLSVLGNPDFCLATDISEQALEIARKNAERNQAEVSFLKSDLFGKISGTFDIIVSNPPYISTEIVEGLMEEVRDHEPRLALDGGEDGLIFYHRIILEGKGFLKPQGWLFFEIGYDQGEAVTGMLQAAGFINIVCKKDYAGFDRVVFGQNGGI